MTHFQLLCRFLSVHVLRPPLGSRVPYGTHHPPAPTNQLCSLFPGPGNRSSIYTLAQTRNQDISLVPSSSTSLHILGPIICRLHPKQPIFFLSVPRTTPLFRSCFWHDSLLPVWSVSRSFSPRQAGFFSPWQSCPVSPLHKSPSSVCPPQVGQTQVLTGARQMP